MADKTSIEWTRGDDGSPGATWNPVTGCTEVSAGCDHCYAKTFAERWRGTPSHYFENGFDVQLRPDKLGLPLQWRKPRRIFVNSMSDLFHDQVPDDYIANVWSIMAWSPRHTYQILTKRHARMRSLLNSRAFKSNVDDYWYLNGGAKGVESGCGHPYDRWPLPNVWLGVSTENQQWADTRIPALLDTPAAVRFISAEPLLGPIDLSQWLADVDFPPCWDEHSPGDECWRCIRPTWVIVGGESGPGARPMHPDWARSLRDQCQSAAVPFLFKQWGEHLPSARGMRGYSKPADRYVFRDGSGDVELANWHQGLPDGALMQRVGKKSAGRLIDGRTWDQYPDRTT